MTDSQSFSLQEWCFLQKLSLYFILAVSRGFFCPAEKEQVQPNLANLLDHTHRDISPTCDLDLQLFRQETQEGTA
jgi:hypothetical protein